MTGLIFMVLSLPISESIKNISIGIATAGFILYSANTRRFPKLYPVGKGFLMLLIAFAITSLFAPIIDFKAHMKGIDNLLKMFLAFVVVANLLRTDQERNIIIWAFLLSTVIGEIWAILDILSAKKHVLEMHSTGHFNHTGIYLSIMLCLNISVLYFLRLTKAVKMALICMLLLSLVSLFLTTSRGSMIGFLAFLIIFPFITRNYKAMLSVAAFLLLSIMAFYLFVPLREKLFSSGLRLEVWKDAFNIFIQSPIVGVGFNQYNKWAILKVTHAHNLYLNTAVQAGLLGLLALAFILGGFLKTWLLAKKYVKDNNTKAYWIAAIGAFTVVVVSGIFNTTLHSEHGLAFSVLSGICASLIRKTDTKSEDSTKL